MRLTSFRHGGRESGPSCQARSCCEANARAAWGERVAGSLGRGPPSRSDALGSGASAEGYPRGDADTRAGSRSASAGSRRASPAPSRVRRRAGRAAAPACRRRRRRQREQHVEAAQEGAPVLRGVQQRRLRRGLAQTCFSAATKRASQASSTAGSKSLRRATETTAAARRSSSAWVKTGVPAAG